MAQAKKKSAGTKKATAKKAAVKKPSSAEGKASAPRPAPDPGDKAPAFALPDQAGKTVRSRDLAGAPYVLFFYPRANTPGCTKETCAFRDLAAKFERAKVAVFGVSPDAPPRQAKFHAQYDVNFPLLCDTEHVLATAYGCYKEKSMYGRKVMGIERSTFLVDAKGKILKAWRKVKVPGHAEAVLEAAKAR